MKSGQSFGSVMTKVGGTSRKSATKSQAKLRVKNSDVSTSWTDQDSGLQVIFRANYLKYCYRTRFKPRSWAVLVFPRIFQQQNFLPC